MKIQDRLKLMEEKLDQLMNNHLKHMDDRLKRQEWLQWGLMMLVIGIAFNQII